LLLALWVSSEWDVRVDGAESILPQLALWLGLSVVYFLSRHRPLVRLGGIGLIPATVALFIFSHEATRRLVYTSSYPYLAFAVVLLGLTIVAWRGLGSLDLKGLAAVGVVGILSCFAVQLGGWLIYPLVAVAYGAMIWWGVGEHRVGLVNGGGGLAITVFGFYVSHALTLLGGSAGLIVFGLLLVGGGFALERARRQLLAQATGGAQ